MIFSDLHKTKDQREFQLRIGLRKPVNDTSYYWSRSGTRLPIEVPDLWQMWNDFTIKQDKEYDHCIYMDLGRRKEVENSLKNAMCSFSYNLLYTLCQIPYVPYLPAKKQEGLYFL